MTYVIVHALAPIFVIMLLGFWAGKAKMVDNKNVSLLNIFVMDFALPAALFSATVQTPWTGIVAQSPLILASILGSMMENNWTQSMVFADGSLSVFVTRPLSCALLILSIIFIGMPLVKRFKAARKTA